MKKVTMALLGICCMFNVNAQTTQVVDLSTGVYDGTTNLIPPNTFDDTWTYKIVGAPGGYHQVKSTTGNLNDGLSIYTTTWTHDPNVRWLSTTTDVSGNAIDTYWGTDSIYNDTTYIYRTTFVSKSCSVNNATITFDQFGADNSVKSISINGHSHSLNAVFHPLSDTTLDVSGDIVSSATNEIIITVKNQHGSYTGLLIDGNLTINYNGDAGLVSHFTGVTSFCYGDPLTFNGSTSTGTAGDYVWLIAECDASGNVASGTPVWWSPFYAGNPGSFTFPTGAGAPTIECNKYYSVTLALQGPCDIWKTSTKTIHINCPPTPNAGPDGTICSGSCITIGTTAIRGNTYHWYTTSGGSTVNVGNTSGITVCPTTTTTYTLSMTNTYTGCSATDEVTITVVNNDPSFSLSNNTSNSAYFTLSATPNNLVLPPGFGYSWFLEDLDASNNAIFTFTNDPAWWTFPAYATSNVFNGFDPFTFTYSGASIISNSSSPAFGQFQYNHKYRITRGTWSDACGWQQFSQITQATRALSEDGNPIVTFAEDHNAPDFSYTHTSQSHIGNKPADELMIYPNPANGIFNIDLNNSDKTIMEVYDVLGNKIQSTEIVNHYQLDLSGYAKGIYMIKMTVNGQQVNKKIILE